MKWETTETTRKNKLNRKQMDSSKREQEKFKSGREDAKKKEYKENALTKKNNCRRNTKKKVIAKQTDAPQKDNWKSQKKNPNKHHCKQLTQET